MSSPTGRKPSEPEPQLTPGDDFHQHIIDNDPSFHAYMNSIHPGWRDNMSKVDIRIIAKHWSMPRLYGIGQAGLARLFSGVVELEQKMVERGMTIDMSKVEEFRAQFAKRLKDK